MAFITDKQTLDDLNLLGKYKQNSVFNLFNHTRTAGAERLLENMFKHPLVHVQEINNRSRVIAYFQSRNLDFPFDVDLLQAAEHYLSGGSEANLFLSTLHSCRRKILRYMGLKREHDVVAEGLAAAIEMLKHISLFIAKLLEQDQGSPFAGELRQIAKIFESQKLNWLVGADTAGHLSFFQTLKYDYLLRVSLREEMEAVMQVVHFIDLYIAVSGVSASKSFTYAKALPADLDCLEIDNGFHPSLDKAVPNSVKLDANGNMIFLTGANMAGKSTFMKFFGISIYLAHMGFPVPAESMVFSVKEGMFTSINVSDDLNMGYSHFYAEVLRVKKIAEAVSRPKNLVVIFDELFKGTNVKDAYDATLAVSKVFSEHRNCFFIVSTHIVEVGEALREMDNIQFTYMPTQMLGKLPFYTYSAKEGISSDRHGMMIIKNERILEILT